MTVAGPLRPAQRGTRANDGTAKALSGVLRHCAAALPVSLWTLGAQALHAPHPREADEPHRQSAARRLPPQPEHRLHALLRGLPRVHLGARHRRRVRGGALHAPGHGQEQHHCRVAASARADVGAVRPLPPLHRCAPRRRRHGRHDGARLRDDGRGQRHQHLRHRVPRQARASARTPSRTPGRSSPPRCAICSPTASRWSTASTTRWPRTTASAPT